MSGFSSQGVGAEPCANAEAVSAASAAAIKKLLVGNPVIVILQPKNGAPAGTFEQITNAVIPSIQLMFGDGWVASRASCGFVIFNGATMFPFPSTNAPLRKTS